MLVENDASRQVSQWCRVILIFGQGYILVVSVRRRGVSNRSMVRIVAAPKVMGSDGICKYLSRLS